jgi:hypothetical protein
MLQSPNPDLQKVWRAKNQWEEKNLRKTYAKTLIPKPKTSWYCVAVINQK